jgi:hypothetical protein
MHIQPLLRAEQANGHEACDRRVASRPTSADGRCEMDGIQALLERDPLLTMGRTPECDLILVRDAAALISAHLCPRSHQIGTRRSHEIGGRHGKSAHNAA